MYNSAQQARVYREYVRAGSEVTFDANGRMLVPKRHMEKIGLPKEVVMVGVDFKVEMWDRQEYEGGGLTDEQIAEGLEEFFGSGTENVLKEGK